MRFIVSSSCLLQQLKPHRGANSVRLCVRRGWCQMFSSKGTTSLPIEGAHHINASLPLAETLAALRQIQDQPITLDLHEHGGNRIYAARLLDTFGSYEPLTFNL